MAHIECSQCGKPLPARALRGYIQGIGWVVVSALCQDCSLSGAIEVETDLMGEMGSHE